MKYWVRFQCENEADILSSGVELRHLHIITVNDSNIFSSKIKTYIEAKFVSM